MTIVTPIDARTVGQRGNQRLIARAQVRRNLRAGVLSPVDVLDDPPHGVRHLLIPELLVMVPGWQRHRVAVLAREAMEDGINLLVRVGDAPLRTRYWLVDRVRPVRYSQPKRGGFA